MLRLAPPPALADSSRFKQDTALLKEYYAQLNSQMNFYGLTSEIVLFFDRKGRLIDAHNGFRCAANVDKMIDSLHLLSQDDLSYKPIISFDSLSGKFLHMDGTPFALKDTDKADYYVVLPWSIWKGKPWNKDVKRRQEALERLRQKGEVQVAFFLVNYDLHTAWKPEWLEINISTSYTSYN